MTQRRNAVVTQRRAVVTQCGSAGMTPCGSAVFTQPVSVIVTQRGSLGATELRTRGESELETRLYCGVMTTMALSSDVTNPLRQDVGGFKAWQRKRCCGKTRIRTMKAQTVLLCYRLPIPQHGCKCTAMLDELAVTGSGYDDLPTWLGAGTGGDYAMLNMDCQRQPTQERVFTHQQGAATFSESTAQP